MESANVMMKGTLGIKVALWIFNTHEIHVMADSPVFNPAITTYAG